jgi:hypothetical protein
MVEALVDESSLLHAVTPRAEAHASATSNDLLARAVTRSRAAQ